MVLMVVVFGVVVVHVVVSVMLIERCVGVVGALSLVAFVAFITDSFEIFDVVLNRVHWCLGEVVVLLVHWVVVASTWLTVLLIDCVVRVRWCLGVCCASWVLLLLRGICN